jgi:hypothetical protein
MQRFIAFLLVSGSCLARPLSAQQSVGSVSSVRLVFEKVDQVALDFGVDTAALRHRAVQRLSAAGIAVVQDANRPELSIAVRVPKRLVPVDDGIFSVEMRLLERTSSNPRRELWRGLGSNTRFTTFGSLRQLIPEQFEQRLDSLAVAHAGT